MLDFSLSELAVVGTIALVVLGPEKLPGAARAAGRWIGKARQFANQMQQELTSQLDTDALRKELNDHQRLLDEQMQETRQALAQVQRDTQHALSEPSSPSDPAALAAPKDRYAMDDEPAVTPWKPSHQQMPHHSVHDAPRPLIAAKALHTPTAPLSDSATATPKRNADDS